MLKGIKNIIFDLGGVILNINQSLTQQAFKDLLQDDFIEIEKLNTKEQLFIQYEGGKISTQNFLERLLSIQENITTQQLIDCWNKLLLDIPKERLELIKELSKKYNVFLLSNTNELHIKWINNYVSTKFGIPSIETPFKKAYLSFELKMKKPDRNIFEHVLSDAGLYAHETLFIDDTKEHIQTASSIGIKTHFLDLSKNQTILTLFNEY